VSHITVEQRYQIKVLHDAGFSQLQIAQAIGKSRSSISREFKRNRLENGKYKPGVAQDFYEQRRKKCRKPSKWSDPALKSYVIGQRQEDKSPEQINGIMKKEGFSATLSHEAIYQFVWADKAKGGKLCQHLRNKGRRYQKRGSKKQSRGVISGRVDIDKRPSVVDQRKRFGDFEVDLVIGKNHRCPLLTIVDRKTGYALVRKLASKKAEPTAEQMIKALMPIKDQGHTITSDNGKEFAQHAQVPKALNAQFYFAKPYHSWQRGSNENYNRLLRQYFPKSRSFKDISNEQVHIIQDKLNNRERKRLNFLSPVQYLRDLFLTKVAFRT